VHGPGIAVNHTATPSVESRASLGETPSTRTIPNRTRTPPRQLFPGKPFLQGVLASVLDVEDLWIPAALDTVIVPDGPTLPRIVVSDSWRMDFLGRPALHYRGGCLVALTSSMSSKGTVFLRASARVHMQSRTFCLFCQLRTKGGGNERVWS